MNCTDFNIHTLNKGRCTCKYKFNLETNSKHSLYWNDIHILFTAADKIKQNIVGYFGHLLHRYQRFPTRKKIKCLIKEFDS